MSEPKMPWDDVGGGFLQWLCNQVRYWDQFCRGMNLAAFSDLKQVVESAVRSGYEQGLAESAGEASKLRERLREQTEATQKCADFWHARVLGKISHLLPDDFDRQGHPIDQIVGTALTIQQARIDELEGLLWEARDLFGIGCETARDGTVEYRAMMYGKAGGIIAKIDAALNARKGE